MGFRVYVIFGRGCRVYGAYGCFKMGCRLSCRVYGRFMGCAGVHRVYMVCPKP